MSHDATSRDVSFTVNGRPITLGVRSSWVLADVLRDGLGLTGTKVGCGVGVCGVCTVIVDGALQSGCLVPAVTLDGRAVVTIEGLTPADGSLSAVQQAFVDWGGFQCGICTSGQIVAATALLAENPHPTEEEVADWMIGNLCRCTGYYGILRSVRAAAEQR